MTHYVYTLYATDDPRAAPRYVGVTRDPARRLRHHRSRSVVGNEHNAGKQAWCESIAYRVAMRIVFAGDAWQCAEHETRLIGKLRARGFKLFNRAPGGESCVPAQFELFPRSFAHRHQLVLL